MPTEAVDELVVVRVEGDQPTMGRDHGRLIRSVGGEGMAADFYPRMVEHLLVQGVPPGLGRRVVQRAIRPGIEAALGRLERARPAPLRDRTRAFLQAGGYDPDWSRYFAVMDTFQNIVGLSGRLGMTTAARLGGAAPPACSTLMAWGDATHDGRVLHARNFDFPGRGVWDTGPVVVYCTPTSGLKYGFVTTRGADVPGVSGFNEAGLTLTMHTRFHERVRFDGITVVDLGHEILRRASTLAEAVAIAAERPVASSWGVAISSASERRAIVIETNGDRVRVVEPDTGRDWLPCANRYHHPDMRVGEVTISPLWPVHSQVRERRLREHVERAAEQGGLTVEAMQAMLGDHLDAEDPRVERGAGCVLSCAITVKSIVVDHDAGLLHLSGGVAPTGWGPWTSVPIDWDGPAVERLAPPRPTSTVAAGLGAIGDDRTRAYARYLDAIDVDLIDGDEVERLMHVECAIALAPDDPSYRIVAAGLHMQRGSLDAASDHLDAALANEAGAFRRGQIHLWAARVADARGRADVAERHRDLLGHTDDPRLAAYRDASAKDRQKRYTPRRLRSTVINFEMADLTP